MPFLGDEAGNEWLYVHGGSFLWMIPAHTGWEVGFEACLLFPEYSISGYSITGPVSKTRKKYPCSLFKKKKF